MAKKFFPLAFFGCFLLMWTVLAQGADSTVANPDLSEREVKEFMNELLKEKLSSEEVKAIKETRYDFFGCKLNKAQNELVKINKWKEDESMISRLVSFYDANDNGDLDDDEMTWFYGDISKLVATANGKWCLNLFINDGTTVDLTPLKGVNMGTIMWAYDDVRALPKVTGLAPRSVSLIETLVSDLSPLKDLPSINCIELLDNPQLADLSPLAKLPHVQKLRLSNNKCRDYAPLLKAMNLASLTYLYVPYAGKFDGETIKGADKLKELRLFGAPLDDLSFLTGKSLEVLQLSLAKGVDLSPLAKLPLKELVVSGEGAANLDFVKNFPRLSAFCVHHAPVRDLSPLAGLPLKELALEALPELTDIAPVAALPQLRLFSLRGTNVSDVGVLAKAAIVDLALCDNPKIAALPFIPSVKVLRLFKTKIKDASGWDGKKIAVVYQDETFPSEKIVSVRYDDENALRGMAAKLSGTNPLDLRKRSGLSLSKENE